MRAPAHDRERQPLCGCGRYILTFKDPENPNLPNLTEPARASKHSLEQKVWGMARQRLSPKPRREGLGQASWLRSTHAKPSAEDAPSAAPAGAARPRRALDS